MLDLFVFCPFLFPCTFFLYVISLLHTFHVSHIYSVSHLHFFLSSALYFDSVKVKYDPENLGRLRKAHSKTAGRMKMAASWLVAPCGPA
jgi:hypothetical protein